MATRRTPASALSTEKAPAPAETVSDIRPAVPANVIVKLLSFTFAMVTLPIGSYFFTLNSLFNGNSSYAGGFAAMMANVVLIAYVVVAMREDQSERLEEEAKAKKAE
ncbi:vacuolar ATPase assembly integral membrane protein [Trichodelitschia bisporula]|uniref:Vacuolar ATPase assembly integral membrane protein n=1 Tax=Trichodelitschia bisporula TaxID=703511 RepID=A0A6G1I6I8_9PEZI|nr:vacuolar ATPase assembly integral membrane protein [Trichodelitschia bisporula]